MTTVVRGLVREATEADLNQHVNFPNSDYIGLLKLSDVLAAFGVDWPTSTESQESDVPGDEKVSIEESLERAEELLDPKTEQGKLVYRVARILHQWAGMKSHLGTLAEARIRHIPPGASSISTALRIPFQYASVRNEIAKMDLFEIREFSKAAFGNMDEETALDLIRHTTSFVPPRRYDELLADTRRRLFSVFRETLRGSRLKNDEKNFDMGYFSGPGAIGILSEALEIIERDDDKALMEAVRKTIFTTPQTFTFTFFFGAENQSIVQNIVYPASMSEYLLLRLHNTLGAAGVFYSLSEIQEEDVALRWEQWLEFLNNEEMHDMPISWWSVMV